MLEIKLSEELKTKVQEGYLRTIEMIKYILDTVSGTTTEKKLNKTSIKDISFSGKHARNAIVDTEKGIIYIGF